MLLLIYDLVFVTYLKHTSKIYVYIRKAEGQPSPIPQQKILDPRLTGKICKSQNMRITRVGLDDRLQIHESILVVICFFYSSVVSEHFQYRDSMVPFAESHVYLILLHYCLN
jgi:hypothetical protein